jgi:hypothetical protein
MEIAARQAGLTLVSTTEGKDFHDQPTAVFELAPREATGAAAQRTLKLELSEFFDFNKPDLLPAMTQHLAEEAKRLRNPAPRRLRHPRRPACLLPQLPLALPSLDLRIGHLHRPRRDLP